MAKSLEQLMFEMVEMRDQTLDQLARSSVGMIRAMLMESLLDLEECIADLKEQMGISC